MGWFSSDRTIRSYADQIWDVCDLTRCKGIKYLVRRLETGMTDVINDDDARRITTGSHPDPFPVLGQHC
jgi:hypothetical protein